MSLYPNPNQAVEPDAVISFIAADVSRRPLGLYTKQMIAIGAIALATAAAFGLREDFVGVYTWSYLTPAALMVPPLLVAVGLVLTPAAQPKRRFLLLGACLTLLLLLTLPHPGAAADFHYESPASFWLETVRCFSKGLLTSAVASALLSMIALRWLPLPSAQSQLASGLVASMVGILMLNLHCMSPHVGHIMLGHWAQALPLAAATFVFQRWWVRRALTRILGRRSALQDLGRLARP